VSGRAHGHRGPTVDTSNAVVEVEGVVVEFVIMRVAEVRREDVAVLHADVLRRLVEVGEVPHCDGEVAFCEGWR